MLHTFMRQDWKEDQADVAARVLLTGDDGPATLRKYYPFKARIIQSLSGVVYGVKEGEELEYARTLQIVSFFPVEAITIGEDMKIRRMYFRSGEVQLVEA